MAVLTHRRGVLIDTSQTVDGASENSILVDAFPTARALVIYLTVFLAAGEFTVEQSIDGGATWVPAGTALTAGVSSEQRRIDNPVGMYRTMATGITGAVAASYQVKV